jgi:excisionase family DNA binding protein
LSAAEGVEVGRRRDAQATRLSGDDQLNDTRHMVERQTTSIMKACELVGVSRRTIYNWLQAGKIEYVRTAGGSVRIFVDTLFRAPDRTAPRVPARL